MGIGVARPVGTKNAEFEAYVRLLRQQGKGLGNLPRAPDPENPRRRRVYLWNTQEEAQERIGQTEEVVAGNLTAFTFWRLPCRS